ncbi:hypothetical protein ACVXHM_32660 [Pseudomonas aeruginosa]|uniref:Copper resistance protein B n=1 Tax=Pseudomonas indica TaxID=137658 RepID=A0A1G8TUP4_9PSED|nr:MULTISPECIES: copper resistance protein CopB [Pseudomonas]RUJ25116.1 copper resistance protein CopB [Pseudomonas aeruginosa]RUJ43154.1 copper resistance protein CopB [Pseudomonas aeruginosa]UCO98118.1 hypothetical protein LF844_26310 [Pseudomonas lalkuanensis]WAG78977.1 hypothetical protein LMK08_27195 [Pseudomonas furukawaii]SDJ45268.1 copper resistance protein B [Pseudomonas indica]
MSQIMKRTSWVAGALSAAVLAVLLVPAAMASEKTHADHEKGQSAQGQQMDHSQMNHDQMQGMDHSKMKDHGSMKHEQNADKAKASQDHDD